MSKAYKIDSDGIIVDSVIADSSFTNYNGTYIKPKTIVQAIKLIVHSEHQKKIKALQAEMKELEEQKKKEYSAAYVQNVEDIFSRLQSQEHEVYIPALRP